MGRLAKIELRNNDLSSTIKSAAGSYYEVFRCTQGGTKIYRFLYDTAENLGNFTYGYFGSAMGYSDELLYWAGGVPNLNIGNLGNLFKEHFGETESDTEYVRLGVERFYKQYGNKYPATI